MHISFMYAVVPGHMPGHVLTLPSTMDSVTEECNSKCVLLSGERK